MNAWCRLLTGLALTAFGASVYAFPGDTIESHDASVGNRMQIDLGGLAGYEGGYIPDALVAPEVGVRLLPPLRIALHHDIAYFPNQDFFRLVRSALDVSYAFLGDSSPFRLAVFGAVGVFWNDALVVPYTGGNQTVYWVTSPRADTGYDLSAGAAAALDFRLGPPLVRRPAPVDLLLRGEARYDYTGGRQGYTGQYGFVNATNRLSIMLAPGVKLPELPLKVYLQNRVVLWFGRGYSYEAMPQLTWKLGSNVTLQAGLGIPVLGAGRYRVLVEGGSRFTVPSPSARVKRPTFQVINGAGGKRLRLYFQFEADRADLFEPQNTRYGKANRRLLQEVYTFLKAYRGKRIVIEGYANRANFALTFEQEQKSELIPLSKARAEAVRSALVEAGIPATELSAVGYGGAHPIADFRDAGNAWRNRRVEIVIKD